MPVSPEELKQYARDCLNVEKIKTEIDERLKQYSLKSALELTMARDSYGYLKPSSEWYSALSKVENLRSSRYAIREQANELLGELQAAKEEAHNQWLAAQQTSC